ncbi:MAG: DUF2235 domain-containing protein [candidate division KSB1 bacterium]|nr:DUF2235 domain-containing protein [candidate division KSB1 bacterium]MDZ7304273.1 DUF2235 domain-containing protein [candidate division KSB1 bacterium]MDZ7312928.1 DUF2235 domain-containing protein [candidate division KSB1 bacterium]
MPKRIVVCSDGTWNTPDQRDGKVFCPTNVVKMARAIAPLARDGWAQVVFYDEGVGTHWGLDRLTGGAFGVGLSKNIKDAYLFLINNYIDGDEIYLFGFSRGAYTVRSTAGLIRKCGLLKKIHADKVPEAYKLYRQRDATPDTEAAILFRQNFSREIRIKFIGVWDTVGALGIPLRGLRFLTRRRYQFHDVRLSRSVDYAYHAVAIDERRKPFKPTLWETANAPGQTVEQVWFAGVHSNIGGGYRDTGLSDLAFLWIKEKAEAAGLTFDQEYIDTVFHPDPFGVMRNSKKGLYLLTGNYLRPIDAGTNSNESVHASAITRYHNYSPPYKPPNLTDYLNKRS